MTLINRTPNLLVKTACMVGWLTAAVGVGVYWALAETLIHRGLFATGFYYNPSFASALNGRIIFYGLTAAVLWIIFSLAIQLVRRLRRRGSARAVGPRAMVGVAAVATWVNLDIVAMYVLYERLGIKVKQGLALPAFVGTPALLVTAALFY